MSVLLNRSRGNRSKKNKKLMKRIGFYTICTLLFSQLLILESCNFTIKKSHSKPLTSCDNCIKEKKDNSFVNISDTLSTLDKRIVRRPIWLKFITSKGVDVSVYKYPNADSPILLEEEVEGYMGSYLVWSDESPHKFSEGRKPYYLNNNLTQVCPVLAETEKWYEVLVQLPWTNNTVKAYVLKDLCKEISPKPMDNAKFYKISNGKYKGKYLYYYNGIAAVEWSYIALGWEIDGGYLFPKEFIHILNENNPDDAVPEHYDFSQLTNETIEQWFNSLTEKPIIEYTVYYNFGGEWPTIFDIDLTVYPFNTSNCDVFDLWSQIEKEEFLSAYKDSLNSILLSYYNKYDSIQNNDSVFEIICACKFIPKQPKQLLSFYAHVFTKAIKNSTDGYVGEMIVDQSYKLFMNYPSCFYEYWNYVDEYTKKILESNVYNAFQLEDLKADSIDNVFDKAIKQCPEYEGSIQIIRENIKQYFKN